MHSLSDIQADALARAVLAAEIANLRKEAHAFKSVRAALLSASPEEAAQVVFHKARWLVKACARVPYRSSLTL